MKIVFTAIDNKDESLVDARFGRAKYLVVFDDEHNTKEFMSNDDSNEMDHGAGLKTIQKVLELNPDLIITGNAIGYKTLDVVKNTDIKVYIGANDMTLDEAYSAYKNDKLRLQY